MIKLIKVKPKVFLFITIGLIPVLFFLIWLNAQIFGPEMSTFSVMLFFGGFIGFYLLWINTISLSLDLVSQKKGIISNKKTGKILFIILISVYLLRMIISLPYFESIESTIGLTLYIIIGAVNIVLITFLFYKVSDNYIFLIKNRTANLFDYFVMLFYFCLFLIGLMMLHSDVRVLLKENNIITE